MQLDRISPHPEGKSTFHVVIETPRGSRNKYGYDPAEGVFRLKKVLPQGHVFPYDFGFVPRTKGADGDPLDVLVLMDEPAIPGCVAECRIVGCVQARQQKKRKWVRNDRFIAVAESSLTFSHVTDVADLDRTMLGQIREFFVSYQELSGNRLKLLKTRGARAARQAIKLEE